MVHPQGLRPGRPARPDLAVPVLRFGLLGPLTVHGADGAALPVRAPKSRALLGALLVEASQPVPRERIEAALWGERAPATARAAVNNHVAELRRALGPDGAARLCTAPQGYQLLLEPGELDTIEFSDAVRAARTAADRAEWAAVDDHASRALALWRGRPLADLPILAEQQLPLLERLLEEQLQAQELRAEARLRRGRSAEALPELARLAAEHPLREVFQRQLILALYRNGRQADALAVYEQARAALAEELGIDPGPALRELHQRILESDPSLDPSPDRAPGPAAGAAVPVPPPAAPAQLPGAVADFSGRQQQLERLRAALVGDPAAASGVRICAVSGVGGVGKTALAVRVAHLAAEAFPDGVLYVDLRGVDPNPAEPCDVLGGFLRGLGMPDAEVPVGEELRAAAFRTLLADRRVLVLLDNARDAAQVRPLLPGSARCAALVTSRRRLPGLAGAVHVPLDSLGPEEALTLFHRVVGDRAVAEPDATARVLDSCAGLPLAVRIAAARLAGRPGWTVAALADRLADQARRLDELHVEDLAVRTTFAMSYAQLGDPDRRRPAQLPTTARVFRLLGLAPGPETGLEAAAALLGCPPSAAEAALEQLVDACLLESPAPGRYRLHDLLRAFAAERAEDEEPQQDRAAAVGRVARWYLDGLVRADAVLFPGAARPPGPGPDAMLHAATPPPPVFRDHADALGWCQAERINLVQAARLATVHGHHHIAWQIPAFGWAYFNFSLHAADWLSTTGNGLRSARLAADPAAEATMLTARGAAFMTLRRWDEARDCLEQALAVRRRIGDEPGQMACLNTLGLVYQNRGDLAAAREHYRRALAFAGPPAMRKREAAVLANLAQVELLGGEPESAVRTGTRALEIEREFGEAASQSSVLTVLGEARLELGAPESAVPDLVRAHELSRSIGYRFIEVLSLTLLGRARVAMGEPWAAQGVRAAEDLAREAAAGMTPAQRERLAALLADLRLALDRLESRPHQPGRAVGSR